LLAGELDELEKILSKGSCDMVFLGGASGQAEQKVLENAEVQGIDVWYFSQLISTQLAKPEIDQYGGRPVIVFKTTSHYEGKLLLKRFFDVTVSLLFLILLSPVFLVIAFLVKITSPGPVFYTQVRTGWRGRSFRMIKFRTMRDGAEDELPALHDQNELKGPVFKSAEDPRITPLGRWLRHYSGDELPQLFNVLKGEMSLVGPRPLPTYETEKFEAFTDHRRHSVLPGLTGLWQVSGRTRIDDFSEWVRLDLQYIDTWNFWLDIVILLRTIPVVLSGKGAK
jgi:exopolysaccharide biosynthesis polyprenyl glycosylphosphotransferase